MSSSLVAQVLRARPVVAAAAFFAGTGRGTLAADRWVTALGFGGAAVALAYATQLANGAMHPEAIQWLTVALVLGALAVAAPRIPRLEALGEAPVMGLLGVALALYFGLLLTSPAGVYLQVGPRTYLFHHFATAAAVVLAAAGLSKEPWLGKWRVPLLLAVHFALGVWLIRASPRPFIDVWEWHRISYEALKEGINPYGLTLPNIYGHTNFYSPELMVNGRVDTGYQYPPLALLLGLFGHFGVGDFRYALLVCMTAAGGLVAYARPGRLASTAAVMMLFHPRMWFVLEQGWTDTYVVFFLALTVFLAVRQHRALPFAVGLLLSSKQYMVLVPPLTALLLPRGFSMRQWWQLLWKALAVVAVINVPPLLLDPTGFLKSVITLQVKAPFRLDALSYLALWGRDGLQHPPLWLGFALATAVGALCLWRMPRSPAGFSAAVALTFLVFFAFAKQAFCNYYFFVDAAMCCAAALAWPEGAAQSRGSSTPSGAPTSS